MIFQFLVGALCVLCELCVSVVERRSPLVITTVYELLPQRHKAHGELTEDSTILLPTRNSEEPFILIHRKKLYY